MADACKVKIFTGYHLQNKEEIVGLDILNVINKRKYDQPGKQYVFELGTAITYGLADVLAIETSACGVKKYKICPCNEDTEIVLDVDKTIDCAKVFNKCLADLNGKDATKELAKRLNETQNNVNADLINSVVDSMKAGGTEVTGDVSTTEGVIKYLEDVTTNFDAAGYLQSWQPTNELGETTGSFGARYVFLDSVVYDKLRKAESTKCCKDLILFPDVSERMQFMGMTIVRVPRLEAVFGVKALAFYAPHVLMVAKCEEEANVTVGVQDIDMAKNTVTKADTILANINYGFKLVSSAAVQYIASTTVTP